MRLAFAILMLLCPLSVFGQKLNVKIVDRQEHDSKYSYSVPGYSSSNTNAYANCNGYGSSVNCNGTATTNTFGTPAQHGSFSVRGATFSLLLPDGRIAVVNCDIKFAEHFAGAAGNHRNCRQPIVDDVQADFHGDSAKLEWVVSLDGKKKQSETYKVLGILDKSKSE